MFLRLGDAHPTQDTRFPAVAPFSVAVTCPSTAYREHNIARLDPARAEAAARGWIRDAGLDGTVAATTTTVTVTVNRASRTQLNSFNWPEVGSLHVPATATATAIQGVAGPDT